MKNKCSKTASGRHIFNDQELVPNGKKSFIKRTDHPLYIGIQVEPYLEEFNHFDTYDKCTACGFVNDLKKESEE